MHVPMMCTVKKIPFLFTKAAGVQTCSFKQRMQCREAWHTNTPSWQTLVNTLNTQITNFNNHQHDPNQIVDDLHNSLKPTFFQILPKNPKTENTDLHHSSLIDLKWKHRRLYLAENMPTLRNFFPLGFTSPNFTFLKELINVKLNFTKNNKFRSFSGRWIRLLPVMTVSKCIK